MVTKAVREARARVRDVAAHHKALFDRCQAQREQIKPLKARQDRARKRASKVPVIIERPGHYVLGTLASWGWGYWLGDAEDARDGTLATGIKRATALIESGAQKLSLSGEGTTLSLRGASQRTRVLSAEDARKIKAARRRRDQAQQVLQRRSAELTATLTSAYQRGTKIEPEVIAANVGEALACEVRIRKLSMGINEFSEQRASDDRADAQAHLDHALSGDKADCPCHACEKARTDAYWRERRDRESAEREKAAKAETARIQSLPRVLFTCPRCGEQSVSEVDNSAISCKWDDRCRFVGSVTTVVTKRVGRAAMPIGPVEKEAA